METSRAILLRRIRFGDTSLIVTWLSADHGKLKTIAKGALRPKSSFAGKLDLFFLCEIAYQRSKQGEIHTAREVVVESAYAGIRESYRKTLAASYFSELSERVSEQEHPLPALFDLLGRALQYLDSHEPDERAVRFFERELIRIHREETGHDSGSRLSHESQLKAAVGVIPETGSQLLALIAPGGAP